MAAPGGGYLVYAMGGESVELDFTADRNAYAVTWMAATGGPQRGTQVRGGAKVQLAPPEGGHPQVAWLTRDSSAQTPALH